MTSVFWNEATEARLLELCKTERRVCDVARGLGCTRNMVIGKLARLSRQGVKIEKNWVSPPGRTRTKTRRRAPFRPRSDPLVLHPTAAKLSAVQPAPEPPLPKRQLGPRGPDGWQRRTEPDMPMRRLELMALRRCQCRWPLGNGPYRFCGNDTAPERSYCGPHHDYAHG